MCGDPSRPDWPHPKKCDLKKPACSRCIKRNVKCTGYRDVNFRDQSARIIDRAKRKNIPDSQPPGALTWQHEDPSGSRSSRDARAHPPSAVDLSTPTVPDHLRPSPTDAATAAFFLTFVNPGHWMFMHNFFQEAGQPPPPPGGGGGSTTNDPISKSSSSSASPSPHRHPALVHALHACGMAVMTFRRRDAPGRAWSQAAYVRALRHVNPLLGNPAHARRDETLIAVMLLITYESLTLDGKGSTSSWRAHLHGASALLRLRGAEAACTTSVGATFYFDLRAQMVLSCIWDCCAMPTFYRDWSEAVVRRLPAILRVQERAFPAIYDLLELRADVSEGRGAAAELFERAGRIEDALVGWAGEAVGSPFWSYGVLHDERGDMGGRAWMGKIHEYRSPIGRTAWNLYRILRMVLNQIQLTLNYRMGVDVAELHAFGERRRVFVDDVCATVPGALGQVEGSSNSLKYLNETYQNTWPLFFAGRSTLAAKERLLRDRRLLIDRGADQLVDAIPYYDSQLKWIISKLRHIHKSAGVEWLAGPVAMLEKDADVYHDFQRCMLDSALGWSPRLTGHSTE